MLKTMLLAALLLSPLMASAGWEYRDSTDPMTSKQTWTATLESTNSLDLASPYGGDNHAVLHVMNRPRSGTEVIFRIRKGQLICSSYQGCGVVIRFDDKSPVQWSGSGTSDHDSTVMFLSNPQGFIAAASKAKRILVQATVFQNGTPILEFSAPEPLVFKAKR